MMGKVVRLFDSDPADDRIIDALLKLCTAMNQLTPVGKNPDLIDAVTRMQSSVSQLKRRLVGKTEFPKFPESR